MSQEIFGLLVRIEATTAGLRAELNRARKGVDDAAGAFDKGAKKAEQSIDRMHRAAATSARLSAEQLNTLKFTASDIIASLGSGMSPLQILLQQGPQVAQSFNFAMTKAKLGIGGFATAALVAAAALNSYQSSLADITVSNRLMGNAIGMTTGDIDALARRASEAAGISVGAAREQTNAYIRAGNIGGDVMERLIGISKDYARATGEDSKEAAKSLADLFSDPLAGAQKLTKEIGLLSDAEMEHVEALGRANKTQEMQNFLLEKFEERLKGVANEVGIFGKAWNGLKGLGGTVLGGIERGVTGVYNGVTGTETPTVTGQPGDREQALLDEKARLEAMDYKSHLSGEQLERVEKNRRKRLDELEAEIKLLREAREEVEKKAAADAEAADQTKQSNKVKDVVKSGTRAQQRAEIDDLEKKLKLLRDNANNPAVGAETRAAEADTIERLEHRLDGLTQAEFDKVDLETYKRRMLNAEIEYSKTLRPEEAQEYLAMRQQQIEQIGTLTTAEERLAQQRGSAVQIEYDQFRQTEQMNEATRLQIEAQERLANAAGKGEAAMRAANAENEIAAARSRSAAEGAAVQEASLIQEAATRKQIAAEQTAELDTQAKHQRDLNAILSAGPEAVEELRIQEQARTLALREGIEGTDAYTAALDRYLRKLRDLSSEEKTGVLQGAVDSGHLRGRQDSQRLNMVGKSDAEQAKILARMGATEELRRMGITTTQHLTEEQRRLVEQVYAQAESQAVVGMEIERQQSVYDELEGVVDQSFDRIGSAITEAFAQGEIAALDFKAVGRAIVSELMQEFIKLSMINPLKNAIFGTALNTLNSVGTTLVSGYTHGYGNVSGDGGTYGGFENGPQYRASGGPVMPGQPYIVGEQRPELFVPSVAGRIVPRVPEVMSAGGAWGQPAPAGDTIHVNLNVSTGVAQTVRAELSQMMPQITQATKAAVADSRQRGGAFSRQMGR